MYSYIKFYAKNNELCEIYFPVQLGELKEVNAHGKNSHTTNFDENKKNY